MKVVLINLKGIRSFFRGGKWCALFLLLIIFAVHIMDAFFYSDKYVTAMQELSTERVVVVDAGHGGEDPGAIGIDGSFEKNLNLAFAFEIGNLLEKEGYTVVYTRTEDKLLYTEDENVYGIRKICDLKNRCKFALEYPNAIFLSIHMNSYSDSKYSGLQVYYSNKNNRSVSLANSIQNVVRETVQKENSRTVKESKGIYVLENIPNPSVLIECGFITNEEECKKLSEKEYKKQLSLAIVYGIIEYNKTFS